MSNEQLQKAIRCVSIQDVYLRDTKTTIHEGFDPKVGQVDLAIQLRTDVRSGQLVVHKHKETDEEVGRVLRVYVETAIRFVSNTPNSERESTDDSVSLAASIKAEIKALFVAEYQVTCPDLEESARDVFAIRNAPFHVWPYWREYIQTTCARSRLPLVVIPMFTPSMVNAAHRPDPAEPQVETRT